MQKILLCLIVAGTASTFLPAKATVECSGQQVCFGEDIMKEVVKQTIYSVGTQVLNKMIQPNGTYYQPTQYYSQPTQNTSPTVQATTQTNSETQEQMIPI